MSTVCDHCDGKLDWGLGMSTVYDHCDGKQDWGLGMSTVCDGKLDWSLNWNGLKNVICDARHTYMYIMNTKMWPRTQALGYQAAFDCHKCTTIYYLIYIPWQG